MRDPFPTEGVPFYKGKKVAVTGATGLIGSYVVKLLKESGAKVRAIVHQRSENPFTGMADTIVGADLMNAEDAEGAVDGCEIVIGGAGITGGVNLPKLDPVSYVGPASAMVINTLHACHLRKVQRFGYLSSTTVYAPSDKAVKEDDVHHSDELYPLYRGIGHSKRFLEKLCLYYHETTGIGTAVIRPAGAYGRFDNFEEKSSHVLPGMVERAIRSVEEGRQAFEVWGDGMDVRDFIHAQDVARCLLLATAISPNGDPFNTASGTGITTGQLARVVLDAVGGKDMPIEFLPGKPSALKTRLVSVEKAERVLGFKSAISIEDGVADVVAWRKSRS
jgi:nucleoside-diphosphate-sugar epimerase